MIRPWEFAVALRYVRSRNKNRFISFISIISMAGIAVSVAVLITVLAVMNGFEYEVRNRILQVVAHASISGFDGRIDDWSGLVATAMSDPRVEAAAPYVDGQAMLVGPLEIRGVQLRGIEPAAELRTSSLGALLEAGELEALEAGAWRIVIGRRLAEDLGVGVGDRLVAIVAQGIATPAGIVPRMRRFEVAGIFNAGMSEFDRSLSFIHLDDARRLFRLGDAVSGVRLAVADAMRARSVVRDVAAAWGGGVYVSDWTTQHQNFFRSIQLTRSIIFVILLLVVAVAAFNIVSTLVMVVKDKRGEIAILRTIGASPAGILGMFGLQGAIVGVVGTVAGVSVGVLAALNIGAITRAIESVSGTRLVAEDVYFISELPSRLQWGDVAQVGGIALLLALLSTVYPAWRGAATQPAEVLRHE